MKRQKKENNRSRSAFSKESERRIARRGKEKLLLKQAQEKAERKRQEP